VTTLTDSLPSRYSGGITVMLTATGFPFDYDNVSINQGSIYTLPVSYASQQSTTVEYRGGLALDTTTARQTTLVGGTDLQAMPMNGRDFTH